MYEEKRYDLKQKKLLSDSDYVYLSRSYKYILHIPDICLGIVRWILGETDYEHGI